MSVRIHFKYLLIKPPEEDGSDHDGDVIPEPTQEPSALQRDVGRPDQQGLPRRFRQAKRRGK